MYQEGQFLPVQVSYITGTKFLPGDPSPAVRDRGANRMIESAPGIKSRLL